MSVQTVPPSVDRGRVAWLLAGGAALVGASVVVAGLLIVRAVRRMEEARGVASAELTGRDLAGLIRGVRYVFLAVAALSAGLGWLIGHPLPFIVALVIAGVDILETTFLLFVVTIRREGPNGP